MTKNKGKKHRENRSDKHSEKYSDLNMEQYEIMRKEAEYAEADKVAARNRRDGHPDRPVDFAEIDENKIPPPRWITAEELMTEEDKIKKKVDKALKGWPWTGCPQKLLTLVRTHLPFTRYRWILTSAQGPYALNFAADEAQILEPRFKLPQADQNSLLFTKLFTNDIILREILTLVFRNHSSSWKFWSTCQEMIQIYDSQIVRLSRFSRF